MKILTLIAFFVLVIPNVFSQKSWTLDECIKYALENNIDIKLQTLQSELAEKDLNQSKYNLLPDLNAGASRQYSWGRSLDYGTYEFIDEQTIYDNYGIQTNMTLFNGLSNYYNIEANKVDFQKSMDELKKAQNDISLQVTTYYLQVLFNKELVDQTKSQLELIQLRVDKTKTLVKVGSSAKGDLYEVEAQLASENLNLTKAKNNLNLSILDLAQILDLDSVQNFDIVVPEHEIELNENLLTVTELYNTALNIMPQIRIAKADMDLKEVDVKLAKSQLYPQLDVRAGYGTSYSNSDIFSDFSYTEQLRETRNTSLSVNLSIPIFNKFNTRTKIQKAKINVANSQLMYDKAKLQLYKEIQQAHADAQAALDQYFSAEEAVKYNKEAFEYTEQKEKAGIINAVDYKIAKNNLIKAEADLLSAKYKYVFQLKILDFYLGKPITL